MFESKQIALWEGLDEIEDKPKKGPVRIDDLDPLSYDRYVVFFSGGKDSLACVLHLLDIGVSPEKIELHHHLVDGNEGSTLMDWPCTEAYCEAVAKHLGTSYAKSWKVGGFEAEMLRNNQSTAAIMVPLNDGHVATGGNGDAGTRKKFPQVSANLSVRWCSSYLKIDVGARYLRHAEKFRTGRTLVVTGERAEESTSRSKYLEAEVHRADLRNGGKPRYIDHWRPIHKWTEQRVWGIIQKHKVLPHPAYYLGWGRVSCRQCIFGSKNQWASVRKIAPESFERIARYEREFGVTIQRKETVTELADKGAPYAMDQEWIDAANSAQWSLSVFVEKWVLPSGAYGESCGPI